MEKNNKDKQIKDLGFIGEALRKTQKDVSSQPVEIQKEYDPEDEAKNLVALERMKMSYSELLNRQIAQNSVLLVVRLRHAKRRLEIEVEFAEICAAEARIQAKQRRPRGFANTLKGSIGIVSHYRNTLSESLGPIQDLIPGGRAILEDIGKSEAGFQQFLDGVKDEQPNCVESVEDIIRLSDGLKAKVSELVQMAEKLSQYLQDSSEFAKDLEKRLKAKRVWASEYERQARS